MTPWDVFTAVSQRRLSIPEAMAMYRMSYPRLVVAMLDAGHAMPAALFDARRAVVDFAQGRLSRADAIEMSGLRDYASVLIALGVDGMTEGEIETEAVRICRRSLRVLDRVPDVPPDPGDELPDG